MSPFGLTASLRMPGRPSGKDLPASESMPAINHDSYSCRAKTIATENSEPPPTSRDIFERKCAATFAQNSTGGSTSSRIFRLSPSNTTRTPPRFGRLAAAASRRVKLFCFRPARFCSPPTLNASGSRDTEFQPSHSLISFFVSSGRAAASPKPSTKSTNRFGRIHQAPVRSVCAIRAGSTVSNSPGRSRSSCTASICSSLTGPILVTWLSISTTRICSTSK